MADLSCELGSQVRLSLVLIDGNTGKFPRATIYGASPVPVAAVDLSHTGLGMYRANWQPPSVGLFNVVYRVFDDAGHTVLGDYEPADERVEATAPEFEPMLAASFDENSNSLRLDVWVIKKGLQVLDVITCEVRVYSADDTLLFTVTDNAADGQGVFRLNKVGPNLQPNSNYSCWVKVTTSVIDVTSRRSFRTVT